MSDFMTLKEACQRFGLAYHRAWYLLARGRVQAQVVGRTWQLSEKQAEELKGLLAGKCASPGRASRRTPHRGQAPPSDVAFVAGGPERDRLGPCC